MKVLLMVEGEGSSPFAISLAAAGGLRRPQSLLQSLMPALAPTNTGRCDAAFIDYQPTGQPFLRTSGKRRLHLSFSRSGSEVWAALCRDRSIGIDAARPIEFRSPYPWRRVFHPDEWTRAAGICPRPGDVAPLLWVFKEAAVKALGCGFGALEPIEVQSRALWTDRGMVRSRIDAGGNCTARHSAPNPSFGSVSPGWQRK